MDEPSLRFLEILFEIFGSPPRQGPGNLASARKALRHYENLPDAPEILDLCCGTEDQTLQLAELTQGSVIAVDRNSANFVENTSMIQKLLKSWSNLA